MPQSVSGLKHELQSFVSFYTLVSVKHIFIFLFIQHLKKSSHIVKTYNDTFYKIFYGVIGQFSSQQGVHNLTAKCY